ncbi:MAG: hypothetical protein L6416_05285, partial [Candidatus Omnitrophica bacterium]|nr:hypothetical protein [Candidatus Omnitrophota bacterium]
MLIKKINYFIIFSFICFFSFSIRPLYAFQKRHETLNLSPGIEIASDLLQNTFLNAKYAPVVLPYEKLTIPMGALNFYDDSIKTVLEMLTQSDSMAKTMQTISLTKEQIRSSLNGESLDNLSDLEYLCVEDPSYVPLDIFKNRLSKTAKEIQAKGKVIFYPFGGFDVHTPFWMLPEATDVVSWGLAQVPQFQKDSCLFSIGCGFLTPFFSTTFSLNSVRLGKRIPILCNNI